METEPKFRRRKKSSWYCVYVLHKTSLEGILQSHVVTLKKWTKKCAARAKLLFCLTYCFYNVLAAAAAVVVARASESLCPLFAFFYAVSSETCHHWLNSKRRWDLIGSLTTPMRFYDETKTLSITCLLDRGEMLDSKTETYYRKYID